MASMSTLASCNGLRPRELTMLLETNFTLRFFRAGSERNAWQQPILYCTGVHIIVVEARLRKM